MRARRQSPDAPTKSSCLSGTGDNSDRSRKIYDVSQNHNEQWNMSGGCDEDDGFYAYLVRCARASERITPEGLEQVYAMSVSVSEADIDRLVAEGELEPGTLRPLRP
jgi:hypothetical protein